MLSDEYKRYVEQIAAKIRRDASSVMRAQKNDTPYKNSSENFRKILELCGGTVKILPELPKKVEAVYVSLGDRRFEVFCRKENVDVKYLNHELGHHYITDKGNSKRGTTFYLVDPGLESDDGVKSLLEKELCDIKLITRSECTPESKYHQEAAADYFAAAITFPADVLIKAVKSTVENGKFDAVAVAKKLSEEEGMDVSYYDVQSRWKALKRINATDEALYQDNLKKGRN